MKYEKIAYINDATDVSQFKNVCITLGEDMDTFVGDRCILKAPSDVLFMIEHCTENIFIDASKSISDATLTPEMMHDIVSNLYTVIEWFDALDNIKSVHIAIPAQCIDYLNAMQLNSLRNAAMFKKVVFSFVFDASHRKRCVYLISQIRAFGLGVDTHFGIVLKCTFSDIKMHDYLIDKAFENGFDAFYYERTCIEQIDLGA